MVPPNLFLLILHSTNDPHIRCNRFKVGFLCKFLINKSSTLPFMRLIVLPELHLHNPVWMKGEMHSARHPSSKRHSDTCELPVLHCRIDKHHSSVLNTYLTTTAMNINSNCMWKKIFFKENILPLQEKSIPLARTVHQCIGFHQTNL